MQSSIPSVVGYLNDLETQNRSPLSFVLAALQRTEVFRYHLNFDDFEVEACPPSIPRGAHAHVVALSKNAKSSEMAMFTREMMVNHNFFGHPTFRQSLVLWNVNTCCRVGDICHTIPCLFPSCSTAMAPTGPRSCPAAARYFQRGS